MAAPLDPSESVNDALTALLEWYAAMGVDAVLEDAPVDRFAESAVDRERRAVRTRAPAGTPGEAPVLAPPRTAEGFARGMAPRRRLPSCRLRPFPAAMR